MGQPTIVRVEGGLLHGRRPRHAGANARLGDHGWGVRVPIVRVSTDDGASGFGACRAGAGDAERLLGAPLTDVVADHGRPLAAGLAFEYPLWDLAARRRGLPVYALAARSVGVAVPDSLTVPCYDTSLYFDDLHVDDDAAGAGLVAGNAGQGLERGHRAFKVKVGRGGRHLPLEQGTRRDVAVVRAVRDVIGPDATLMLDANNGYNLNLAKRVLAETADCAVDWIEEPFHEDPVLYRDLRDWLDGRGLAVRIADGEGQAAPALLEWARDGLVDVVQYDILGHGFTRWLTTGRTLDGWGVASAPHHYGVHFGNYAACHLAAAVRGFARAEWDEATTPGLEAPGYALADGRVTVPARPGFGLELDDERFAHAVATGGFSLAVGGSAGLAGGRPSRHADSADRR